MAEKDGGPAFPVTPEYDLRDNECVTYSGMSLRDWFAGQALAGILTQPHVDAAQLAENAYTIADFMLEEREKDHA